MGRRTSGRVDAQQLVVHRGAEEVGRGLPRIVGAGGAVVRLAPDGARPWALGTFAVRHAGTWTAGRRRGEVVVEVVPHGRSSAELAVAVRGRGGPSADELARTLRHVVEERAPLAPAVRHSVA